MNKTKILASIIILLGSTLSVLGQRKTNSKLNEKTSIRITTSLQSEIDSLVAPYLETSSFSGEILVSRNGKMLFDKGYGVANYELN